MIERAGIRLTSGEPKYDDAEGRMDDSEESDDGEVEDLTEDISHLRKWDDDGARKRSAKEVASDMTLPEAERAQAREWMKENMARRKKGKTKQATTRTQAGRQRQGRKATERRGHKSMNTTKTTTAGSGTRVNLDTMGDDYGPLEQHAAATESRVGGRERGRPSGVRRRTRY